MALRVELKPNEKIIIGSCVITNFDKRTKLLIEGEHIPVLREKDILTPATADTPAKLLYLAVQLMYLSTTPQEHHEVYFDVMRDLMATTPSAIDHIQDVNNCILSGDYYKALKAARRLTEHEAQLIKSADAVPSAQPRLVGAA